MGQCWSSYVGWRHHTFESTYYQHGQQQVGHTNREKHSRLYPNSPCFILCHCNSSGSFVVRGFFDFGELFLMLLLLGRGSGVEGISSIGVDTVSELILSVMTTSSVVFFGFSTSPSIVTIGFASSFLTRSHCTAVLDK